MNTVPVTARSGERLKVFVQTKTAHHGYDEHTGAPVVGWVTTKIEEFASETRHFEVAPDKQRVIVEAVAVPTA
jgi:hypothetical protein